ncbi:hypothetical protein D3C85_1254760 [compost metagenome]
MDGAQVADGVRLKMDRAFLNLPVHAGFTLPDLNRLFAGQVVAQAMPGSSASVGHGFNEMSHENDSLRMKGKERRFINERRLFTKA